MKPQKSAAESHKKEPCLCMLVTSIFTTVNVKTVVKIDVANKLKKGSAKTHKNECPECQKMRWIRLREIAIKECVEGPKNGRRLRLYFIAISWKKLML